MSRRRGNAGLTGPLGRATEGETAYKDRQQRQRQQQQRHQQQRQQDDVEDFVFYDDNPFAANGGVLGVINTPLRKQVNGIQNRKIQVREKPKPRQPAKRKKKGLQDQDPLSQSQDGQRQLQLEEEQERASTYHRHQDTRKMQRMDERIPKKGRNGVTHRQTPLQRRQESSPSRARGYATAVTTGLTGLTSMISTGVRTVKRALSPGKERQQTPHRTPQRQKKSRQVQQKLTQAPKRRQKQLPEVVDLCKDDDDDHERVDTPPLGRSSPDSQSVGADEGSCVAYDDESASRRSTSGRTPRTPSKKGRSTRDKYWTSSSGSDSASGSSEDSEGLTIKSRSSRKSTGTSSTLSSNDGSTTSGKKRKPISVDSGESHAKGKTASSPCSFGSNVRELDRADHPERPPKKKRASLGDEVQVVATSVSRLSVEGTGDLVPGYMHNDDEDDSSNKHVSVCNQLDDDKGTDVCAVMETIESEPVHSARKPRRTSADDALDGASSASDSWGPGKKGGKARGPYSETQGTRQSKLNISKVNGKTQKRKGKKPANPIIIGSTIPKDEVHQDELIDDRIENCDSSVEEERKKPAASRPRQSPFVVTRRSNRAPRKKRNSYNDDSDWEWDGDTDPFPSPRTTTKYPSKTISAVRIAIGKKVLVAGCEICFEQEKNGATLTLSYDRVSQAGRASESNKKRMEHKINLCDESLEVMKYFVVAENTVVLDYDESANMSFLAMKVAPNKANGLDKLTTSYVPNATTKDPDAALKRYISVEFRSAEDFHAFLKVARQNETLSAYLAPESMLTDGNKEEYGIMLLEEAKNEYKKRQNSLESPLKRRSKRKARRANKNLKEIQLVYPFDGDPDEINRAADDLPTASLLPVDGSEVAGPPENGEAPRSDNDAPVEKSNTRGHFLTITEEDIERLDPGEFLNDTLIDFWMRWISRHESKADSPLHIFTSHFYTMLLDEGVEAVASWTARRKINVFLKKMIFIPINKSLHWSLCVVVNPGAILNTKSVEKISKKELYEQLENNEEGELSFDSEFPCILFMDSLKAHQKRTVAKKVREWLNSEWRRLRAEEGQDKDFKPFNERTMMVLDPHIPYQDNSWDCGVFVCRYGYALYMMRHRSITFNDFFDKFKIAITGSKEFDFSRGDIVELRKEVMTLIRKLSKIYKKWKKEKDAEEEREEKEKKEAKAKKDQKHLEDGKDSASAKDDEGAKGEPGTFHRLLEDDEGGNKGAHGEVAGGSKEPGASNRLLEDDEGAGEEEVAKKSIEAAGASQLREDGEGSDTKENADTSAPQQLDGSDVAAEDTKLAAIKQEEDQYGCCDMQAEDNV